MIQVLELDHEFLLPHLCFLSGYSYYSLYWLCVLFGTQVPAASCLFFLEGFEYPGVRIQGTRPKKYIKTPRASARVTQYIGSVLQAPFCWGCNMVYPNNQELEAPCFGDDYESSIGFRWQTRCAMSFLIWNIPATLMWCPCLILVSDWSATSVFGFFVLGYTGSIKRSFSRSSNDQTIQ